MRCVILGGAGFLARHVGHAMALAGYEVWSVDKARLPQTASLSWLSGQVTTDFSDVDAWLEPCQGADVVVHLASDTVPATANSDPVLDAQSNLLGTLRLLVGLQEKSPSSMLLFASSGGAVYGIPQSVPLGEDHQTVPIGAYGVTKMAIEHHLRIAESLSGLPHRILRLSNPYGEFQRPVAIQGVIAVFANNALNKRPMDIWGDGSVIRDFVYAADVGRAFVAAAQYQGRARIFNIGGGAGYSVNHIIEVLEHLVGHSIARRTHPARPFDPPINVLDIRRAKEQLNWQPTVAFEEGVAKTLAWLRSEPSRT